MFRLSILTIVTSSFLLAGTAAAQGYPQGPPPPPPAYQQPNNYGPAPAPMGIQREGFVIGFSLGGGLLTNDSCDTCDSLDGPAGDLHLGFMINPKLALLVEGYAVSHTENGITLTQSMGLLAAQFWLAPNMWLKGGLGTGHLSLSNDAGDAFAVSEDGAGFMVAGGYEVYQGAAFTVDLALRVGAVNYQDADTVTQSAASVGVNWY